MDVQLTIAIPTYKRKECLKRLVGRLLQYRNYNFKIFVSDNASGDGTKEICEAFMKECSNFSYYVQEMNVGYDRNVINCVKNCTTKYIWFLSDDDLISEELLIKVMETIDSGADGILVNSNVYDALTGKMIIDNLNECNENSSVIVDDSILIKYAWWSTLISSQIINKDLINSDKLSTYIGTCFVQIGMFWESLWGKKICILGNGRIQKFDGNESHFNADSAEIWTKNWMNAISQLNGIYTLNACRAATASLYKKRSVSSIAIHVLMLKKDGKFSWRDNREMIQKIKMSVGERVLLDLICLCPSSFIKKCYELARRIKKIYAK